MSRAQRFSGYAWECDGCRKKLKAATLLVLDQQIDAHLVACVPALKRKLQAAAAAAAQGDLFGRAPDQQGRNADPEASGSGNDPA